MDNNKPRTDGMVLAGRLYTGRGNGLQSADRCVMQQRTGASVFFERIREGAWFRSAVFVRFLLRFYEKFQEILNLVFQNIVSFNVQEAFVFIGLFLFCSVVDKWLQKYEYLETRYSTRKYDKLTCCPT